MKLTAFLSLAGLACVAVGLAFWAAWPVGLVAFGVGLLVEAVLEEYVG